MPATFQWSETNGPVPGTVTDGISNLNFGDVDQPNLVPSSYPIVAGQNSYEKWFRAKFSGTFTEISNMKFWKSSGSYKVGEVIKCDRQYPQGYVQPVKTTSIYAVNPVPESESNAIIVRSSTGESTITSPGYTEYLCAQLQTTTETPAGTLYTKTFTFQYDEV